MDFSKLSYNLSNAGVKSVYFCAGARNAPLLKTLKEFKIHYAIDERSAAFSALGEAKLTGKPCVICTTSGTAVAECLPAFVEAYYSGVKLILISADRPRRLHDSWAPQTINQKELMGFYARGYFSGDIEQYTNIGHTLKHYPLHINIEIDDAKTEKSKEMYLSEFDESLHSWLEDSKAPLFIFTEGSDDYQDSLEQLDSLGYATYVERLSRLDSSNTSHTIRFDSDVQRLLKEGQIDRLILIGRVPIAKFWRILETEELEVGVLSLLEQKFGLSVGEYIRGFKKSEFDKLQQANYSLETKYTESFLNDLLKKYPDSEASCFQKVIAEISKESVIFIGNSMPIRYWELIGSSHQNAFACRGANGIDGQISTAIGMARVTDKDVYCLIGDLTLLYDLSSLIDKLPSNLKIICFNNKGGRIFERVSVDQDIVLEHEKNLTDLISTFAGASQVQEIFPNNFETQKFWSEWSCL